MAFRQQTNFQQLPKTTSKEIEKFFNTKTKQAVLEGWICRKCRKTSTMKNRPLFRLCDYMSENTPLEFTHQYC